jgi:hypothetical protein
MHNVYQKKPADGENFNIKDCPVLVNSVKASDSGHKLTEINGHTEEVFWDWVTTKDGSRKLLIVYSMKLGYINEFSFVFIISYLLIIFILMLVTALYINYRNDYLTSMVNLYNLSSSCCNK